MINFHNKENYCFYVTSKIQFPVKYRTRLHALTMLRCPLIFFLQRNVMFTFRKTPCVYLKKITPYHVSIAVGRCRRFLAHQNSPFSVVVIIVVVVCVNFSQFHLLLQNHWVNFNQILNKASLDEGDSSFIKWRVPPFSKGRWLR